LLRCLHNSKRYFKLPLVAPIAKKIISKKTRNEKYMDKCLVTNLCSMMGMFTFVILFFINKGIRVQIHTTNSFVFEFTV
jgi:ACR3 family arsenite efflux pump ArsB